MKITDLSRTFVALAALIFAAPAAAQEQPTTAPVARQRLQSATVPDRQPNIVVIVADDVGFTDLGPYGGEARTPNIDALAQRGAQFSRSYSSPLCSPSRAMLLTGSDHHLTGHPTMM